MPAAKRIVLLEWVGVDEDGEEYFDADEIAVSANSADEAKTKALRHWRQSVGDRWQLKPEKVTVLCTGKKALNAARPAAGGRAR